MAGTQPDTALGVYGISVAAELVGTGVQNLRALRGARPARADPHRRRHPPLQRQRPGPAAPHRELLNAGLNLAGIAMVLDLQDENTRLRADHPDPDE